MKSYIKFNKSLLFLISCFLTYSQENHNNQHSKQKDSLFVIVNKLDQVIIESDPLNLPLHSSAENNLTKCVVLPKNVADLFKNQQGFSIIKRGGYAIDPSFRGYSYEQLNLQFDGATKVMNACPNRMDPITTHVLPEQIDKIEVIKGPFSVRYGAIFGAMVNLVSKPIDFSKRGFAGMIQSGIHSNGFSSSTVASLSHTNKQFYISSTFGFRSFDDYLSGGGGEVPSSFSSTDYDVKIGYRFLDNQVLNLKFRQSFGRSILHAGLPMDTEFDNTSIASLDHQITINKAVRSVSTKLYFSMVDHLMTNELRPNFMMVEATSNVKAYTSGIKSELEFNPKDNLTLFMGLDALLIQRKGDRHRLVKKNMMGQALDHPMSFIDDIWQDSKNYTFGVFTQAKYKITSNLVLSSGVRLDQIYSKSDNPQQDFLELYKNFDSDYQVNTSVNTSMRYRLRPQTIVELGWGRGVRSANMIERYINHFSVGQDSNEYVGNPFLKPEKNNQIQGSLESQLKLRSLAIDFGMTLFYSDLTDLITPINDLSLSKKFMPNQQPLIVKRFTNIESAYRFGGEFFLRVPIVKRWSFESNLAYVKSRNKVLNEAIALTPPFDTKLHLGYRANLFWFKLTSWSQLRQNQLAESFSETQTPAFTVLSARLGFKLFKKMDMGIALTNILDKKYYTHQNFLIRNQSTNQSEPIYNMGRNLSARLQYRF